jgi:hypothetical protein
MMSFFKLVLALSITLYYCIAQDVELVPGGALDSQPAAMDSQVSEMSYINPSHDMLDNASTFETAAAKVSTKPSAKPSAKPTASKMSVKPTASKTSAKPNAAKLSVKPSAAKASVLPSTKATMRPSAAKA